MNLNDVFSQVTCNSYDQLRNDLVREPNTKQASTAGKDSGPSSGQGELELPQDRGSTTRQAAILYWVTRWTRVRQSIHQVATKQSPAHS